LINLKSIDLSDNQIITDEGIKNLSNLSYLNLKCNKVITDNGIINLIDLKHINLDYFSLPAKKSELYQLVS